MDLTLLSIDGTKLPVGLQMRRMPLCEQSPYPGETVVVAIPEGTAPSRILPRQAIPADLRARFGTAIADVASTGNSGSGVFDAHDLCLLGIISRKISVTRRPPQDRRALPHDRHRQVFRPGGGDQGLHPAGRLVLDRDRVPPAPGITPVKFA